jgi:hypothetical protein
VNVNDIILSHQFEVDAKGQVRRALAEMLQQAILDAVDLFVHATASEEAREAWLAGGIFKITANLTHMDGFAPVICVVSGVIEKGEETSVE